MKRLIPGYIAGLVLAVSVLASAPALALGLNMPVPPLHVPVVTAEVSTGKFCRLFGPPSKSPKSFAVRPLFPRSIPSPALETIEFD